MILYSITLPLSCSNTNNVAPGSEVLFKDKELRNKLLFSLFLLLVFRILSHIPVPWVDTSTLKEITETGILSLTNLFSGGALQSYTFMATGISAYISASIVIQLLTYISPKMHAMSKEAGGSKKIKKITIFFGIIAALISSNSCFRIFFISKFCGKFII